MLVTLLAVLLLQSPAVSGQVKDAHTHKPIAGAWIVSGKEVTRTVSDGQFKIDNPASALGVRAQGYGRVLIPIPHAGPIVLSPLEVRGLYLSFWGVGSRVLSAGVLDTAKRAHLNTIVVDVKGAEVSSATAPM